jgi:hypothetical protein
MLCRPLWTGLEAVGTALLPHPVSDQTAEQMVAKAEGVFDAVMGALHATPAPIDCAASRAEAAHVAAAATAECAT